MATAFVLFYGLRLSCGEGAPTTSGTRDGQREVFMQLSHRPGEVDRRLFHKCIFGVVAGSHAGTSNERTVRINSGFLSSL